MEGLVHEVAGQANGQGPRTDARVSIRVATPWDGEGLRAMFSRASTETIYRRFQIAYQDVPERTLALMLDVDHHDDESLVAIAGGEIVGNATYARLGSGTEAEMAIVVEDGWQSKGVGTLLLSELAQRARHRGIETFIGEVLRQNRRMLGLAAMFAGASRKIEDGEWLVRMPLHTLDSAHTLPRAA